MGDSGASDEPGQKARAAVRADPGSVRYVILDGDLQRTDPSRFGRLLAGFTAGYDRMFRGDEAESAARWPARIAGAPAPQPVLRIVVALEGHAARRAPQGKTAPAGAVLRPA